MSVLYYLTKTHLSTQRVRQQFLDVTSAQYNRGYLVPYNLRAENSQ